MSSVGRSAVQQWISDEDAVMTPPCAEQYRERKQYELGGAGRIIIKPSSMHGDEATRPRQKGDEMGLIGKSSPKMVCFCPSIPGEEKVESRSERENTCTVCFKDTKSPA